MKKKNVLRTKTSKRIKEKNVKKYENLGERSPYRDYLDEPYNNVTPHDSYQTDEPVEANPDGLPESAGLWFSDPNILTDLEEKQLEAIKAVFVTLTPTQRQIIHLVGYEGKTFDNAAVILGVKKGTIQKTVERVRDRVTSVLLNSNSKDNDSDVLQNEGC